MSFIRRIFSKKLIFGISTLCLLIVLSCTYKPGGDFYRELNQNLAPPDVTITNTFGSDTVVLMSYQSFNVTINSVGSHRYWLNILIDGLKKYTEQTGSGTFSIHPSAFITTDGFYHMTLEFYVNTNSGSIADNMGAEAFVYRKEIVLVMLMNQDSFYPTLVFSTVGGMCNATLNIPVNVKNVRKIVVTKSVDYSAQTDTIGVLIGQSPFIIQDPDYVGEEAHYNVKVYIGNNENTIFVPLCEGSTHKDNDMGIPSVTLSDNGFPVLHWKKTKYYSSCSGYRLFNKTNYYDPGYLLADLNNPGDTVFEASDVGFPGSDIFYVSCVPQIKPSWYDDEHAMEYYSKSTYFYPGLPSFYFDRYYTPIGPDLYYSSGPDHIYRYSIQANKNIDSLFSGSPGWFYTIAVSPNNKYLLAATGNINFNYLLYDATSRQVSMIPGSQIIGTGNSTGIISIADNGTAAICTGNTVIVYDCLMQHEMGRLTFTSASERCVISPSGDWLFAQADKLYLYSFTGNTFQKKWQSDWNVSSYVFYNFVPDQDYKAVIIQNQTVSVRNCDDWSIETTYTIPVTSINNIDFNSNRILCIDQDHFRIFDLAKGNQLKAMRFGDGDGPDLRIRDNTIYYRQGKKLIVL